MADLSDVADTLVSLIAATLYPNGVGNAPEPSVPVKVYPGWPDPKTLNEDLTLVSGAASARHVSVYNLPMERNTTRYPSDYEEDPAPATTYAAALVANSITITGAPPNPARPQNVAVAVGRKAYAYTTAPGDTPAQIASALAALIAVDAPGTAAVGATLTVPSIYRVKFARVGVIGSAQREVSRQEKGFQITVWAESHAGRTEIGKALTPVLAATPRLQLPDGSWAHLTCRSFTDSDRSQRQNEYRRDLVYTVEYATTQSIAAPQVIAVPIELQNPPGVAIAETVE